MFQKISGFRRILPQLIAATIKSVIVLDIGLRFAVPSIIIAPLIGIPNEHNRDEFLSITAEQASWMGSIVLPSLLLGSLLSGPVSDPLGRKKSLLLVNIPFAIGWFMLYQATEVWQIFVALIILGFANGLVEAPIGIYVSEISEPSVRGIMIVYSGFSISLGGLAIFGLNSLMPWRSVALLCLAVPIISAIGMCFVPETPQWLLSKNRPEEAERSLCWLRGWVGKEIIAQEFSELQRHSERSKSCNECIKKDIECSHPLPTMREKLAELKRKSTLKPFAILIPLSFLFQFSGHIAMQPFIVPILKAYESPIALDKATTLILVFANIGQVLFLCLVRFTGKRNLYLATTLGVFLCSFTITCYGFMYLPSGYNSFDLQNQSFHLENPNLAYIPLVCQFLWSLFSNCAHLSMPWILQSEIFPQKVRGVACGIGAAINGVFGFISVKSYYNLETTLSLPGITLFYCILTGVVLVLMYFIFPETEGRSLEDIERHFSDNSKKLTDWKITKTNTHDN